MGNHEKFQELHLMIKKKRTVDLEAMKWHVLLSLYNSSKPVSPGHIKSEMLGVNVSYDDLYDNLFQLGYVYPVTEGIQLTKEGRHYMQKELKEERQRILQWLSEDEYNFALLDFLYHRPHLVNVKDFPEMLVQKAPVFSQMGGRYNLSYGLQQKLKAEVEHVNGWYAITETGRDMFEIRKNKSGGRPVGIGI